MKSKKGFTLIELLAVIVILGLLMAIAIPSVTKYITESRKKTVVSTIGNYITAMVNEVNDLTYTFTEENTIYAVPVECIALERGGTNPFGAWHQANDAYWAYVLVQYDDETSSYRYGYTFKDSAGYGLYPTTQAKLNEGGKQIQTGLKLNQPSNGKITNITSVDNWRGFDVDSTTNLVVLKSEVEGNVGDGKTTCTLHQKGDNYEYVEGDSDGEVETKPEPEPEPENIDDYTLIPTNTGSAFWQYRKKIKTVTFQDVINIPNTVGNNYKWDMSVSGNGHIMAYVIPNNSNSSYYDLYIQSDGKLYANPDSSRLFSQFNYLDEINNIEMLNTSKVVNMSYMFYYAGESSSIFKLDLGSNFDTSRVTDMSNMFDCAGYSDPVFTLGLGDKFDTSNVTNMYRMFGGTGYRSTVYTLDLGDKFDTSNVTNMNSMFMTGFSSTVFTLDLGDKFDTSNVTDMGQMFQNIGYNSTVFTLDLGNKFDTSNVVNMGAMFANTAYNCPVFTLNLGNKFNTSKVTNMSGLFSDTGYKSTKLTLDLGDKFDTSNVTNMYRMFYETGYSSTVFTLDLGDDFDTSKVTNMQDMFLRTGYKSTKLTLDLGDKFNTSNVTNMVQMFYQTGYSSPIFTLDLGDKFDTSNVTDMLALFYYTGYSSPDFYLDCSKWNVEKVTRNVGFNQGVTSKVIPPKW